MRSSNKTNNVYRWCPSNPVKYFKKQIAKKAWPITLFFSQCRITIHFGNANVNFDALPVNAQVVVTLRLYAKSVLAAASHTSGTFTLPLDVIQGTIPQPYANANLNVTHAYYVSDFVLRQCSFRITPSNALKQRDTKLAEVFYRSVFYSFSLV